MLLDFKKIKEEIHNEEEWGTLKIIAENEHFIEITDEYYHSRPTLFTDPETINDEWIKDRFWIHPEVKDFPLDIVLGTSQFLNRNLLINLRHIIVLNKPSDLEAYVKDQFNDPEYSKFMEMLPKIKDGAVSQYWFYGSCPILFMDTIKTKANDKEIYHDYAMELLFGTIRILGRELCKLGQSNPFGGVIFDDELQKERQFDKSEFCGWDCDCDDDDNGEESEIIYDEDYERQPFQFDDFISVDQGIEDT